MKLKKVCRAIIKPLAAVSGLVGLVWWVLILSKDQMCKLPTTGAQMVAVPFFVLAWWILMIRWLENELDY